MEKNLGNADRIIRALLAIVIFTLYLTTNLLSNVFGILVLLAGSMVLLTSMIGICPLCFILGIKTAKD